MPTVPGDFCPVFHSPEVTWPLTPVSRVSDVIVAAHGAPEVSRYFLTICLESRSLTGDAVPGEPPWETEEQLASHLLWQMW